MPSKTLTKPAPAKTLVTPQTPTPWTEQMRQEGYGSSTHDQVENRPVVAWFAKSSANKGVYTLIKATASRSSDQWIISGHNYTTDKQVLMLGPARLDYALDYLTPTDGWTLCEFPCIDDFHSAVLDYGRDCI